MIGRAQIEALIPHAGRMCLLDRIEAWDARTIRCRATSHRDSANPLAVNGRLGAACGVEYAAQAMALHGGLTGAVGGRPRAGYLASLRALSLKVERLDGLAGDLIVEAERLAGEGASVSYGFSVSHDGIVLLSGRAAVILEGKAT
ncbi:phosphotransferase [Aliidongia dinghuensis]|uniref:Phosphotransferase n=1 Tax=Aliidongia dinghuensis TaxID=1867774 RepID=A0A8J2Z1D4_9PROT|nr:3-hydroxylacyl-ACP dehydratase [Aliidongia dinghuensis]GGF46829.1 phosphotransferase [Aliidongia dinghuensis]